MVREIMLDRPTCMALFLLVAAWPAQSRAQNAIPPVGEPPPPEARAAEQAALEQQARDEYARAHTAEFEQQAAQEVEAERRAAWDQRGRDLVPPAAWDKRPAVEIHFSSRVSGGAQSAIGGAGGLELRMKRYWGFSAAGGVSWFRDSTAAAVPLLAAFVEPTALVWLGSSKGDFAPDHLVLRVGMQTMIPLGAPKPPSVYLSPFFGIGGVLAFRPLTSRRTRGFVGFLFEARFGYRFAVGAASPLEGSFVESLLGPVVGF